MKIKAAPNIKKKKKKEDREIYQAFSSDGVAEPEISKCPNTCECGSNQAENQVDYEDGVPVRHRSGHHYRSFFVTGLIGFLCNNPRTHVREDTEDVGFNLYMPGGFIYR